MDPVYQSRIVVRNWRLPASLTPLRLAPVLTLCGECCSLRLLTALRWRRRQTNFSSRFNARIDIQEEVLVAHHAVSNNAYVHVT